MRAVLIGLALLLAGCGEAPPAATAPTAAPDRVATAAAPTAAPAPAAPTANAPASLVGEWRVAGIDGEPLDAPIGIGLSITPATISFEPRCLGFVWRYTFADGALETVRDTGPPLPPGTPPPPVCLAPITPDQVALGRALDAARQAVRTPANAVELSGGGHTVTLFSQ